MDEARRFRFLIPPFFLALSVATGLYFSDFGFGRALESYGNEQLVLFGAVAGASLLPVGFFVTSVSILCLHLFARIRGWGSHEAVLAPQAWERLWPLLSTTKPLSREWHLYGSATFDHELISTGVHEWIQRRWTTFNVSIHSVTAVVVAHLAVLSPIIHESWQWALLTLLFGVILGVCGAVAWRHTMRMLEFQASRSAANQTQSDKSLQPAVVTATRRA